MTLYHFKSDLLIWALFDAYDELKKFKKKHKLTKKEKERLHWWVDAGNSAYDLRWLYELREEEELDELLSGLTDAQVNYVYSHCMNWDPFMEEPFFDFNGFDTTN